MKMSELHLPVGIETCSMETAESVAGVLAEDVARFLKRRLDQAREATLVVSGGSTPLPFFRALREKHLDWARVKVVLADERWVPESDPASNTALVKQHLLQGRAGAAQFVSLMQPGPDPVSALPAMDAAAGTLPLPLDVVVLGMGNDGHAASLFPDAPELSDAMDSAGTRKVAVMTPPSQAQVRVTLTMPVLARARFTALHLKGESKLDTLSRAADNPADWKAMPVRAFLKPGLKVYWSP